MRKSIFSTLLVLIMLFCLAGGGYAATSKQTIFDVEYETSDSFIIHSTLTYPSEAKTVYPLVVMLHSLGYASSYWGTLASDFNKAGFATLEVDLKGHGKSATDTYFRRRSWIYFDDKDFQTFPQDVVGILKETLSQHKNISANYVSYVGADLGANVAIWAAQMNNPKPVCMVLISPYIYFKGLHTPIRLANAGKPAVMAIAAQKDYNSVKQVDELGKYAQGTYLKKIYPNGGTGMIMLKLNSGMSEDIVNWVVNEVNKK